MIRLAGGSHTYKDGTTFTETIITESHNGWYYKPDAIRTEAEIRTGRNKAFSRRNGYNDGLTYLLDAAQAHHDGRDWEVPVKNTAPAARPDTVRNNSLSAAFQHPTFGWITLSISAREGSGYRDKGTFSITWRIGGSSLLMWFMDHKVDRYNNTDKPKSESVGKNKELISKYMKAFSDDPYGEVMRHVKPSFIPFDPPNLEGLDFKEKGFNDLEDEGTWSTSSGHGLFYLEGVIEEIFQSEVAWGGMRKLFEALTFVGFKVHPIWSYGARGYRDEQLKGIEIVVPKQDNMHAHSITIHATNPQVSIECGYQQDEERWMDREKRKAAEAIIAMTQSLETTEWELGLGGDNE